MKKRQTPEVQEKEETCRYDFTPNGVDLKSFPHNAWRKLSKEILLDDEVELFRLGDPQGELSFRKVICDYLYQARGVKCDPHQIIVGAGNDYLLMMLCSVIGRNHVIAVENPAYKQAYRLFSSQSYPVEPIEMDALWYAGGYASGICSGYCICDAVPSVSYRYRDANEA